MGFGGFDENYTRGIAFEDNDLLMTIMHHNIPIITRDDLVVVHIEHGVGYQSNRHLNEINRQYYMKKWNEVYYG